MATPMTLAQVRAAYRRWGVRYREHLVPGRPGSFAPIGIMIHHTAGSDGPSGDVGDERVLTQGRSDLPAPLCHDGVTDDGTDVVITTGRANHAGRGDGTVVEKIQARKSAGGKPGADDTDGNTRFYGYEIMYSGTKPMSAAQHRATVLACAARCEFHGWNPEVVIVGHKEWTRRKVDPYADMEKLRADVATELRLGPPSLRVVAKPPTTATAGDGGKDNDMTRLVIYNKGVYLIGGLFRRYVPWTKDQTLLRALTKAYGPAQPIAAEEMNMYTPIDTVLAIQGAVAKNVGLTLTGTQKIATDLDELQNDLVNDDVPGDDAPGASA